MHTHNHAVNLAWLLALLPLLLAAVLVVPFLGTDVFDADEAATMINAGARHLGPYSPAEFVAATSFSPDQAWGLAVPFALWGAVVGWSEYAVRALPWLVGLLTLAWVFRIGRDLFSQRVALTATLLLATSSLFVAYMSTARSYGPAMLFAAIVLWSYWRIARPTRTPRRGSRILLLLAATSLLYMHYFGALLLPALALYHLFFVRKERRWWWPVFLFGLAGLLATPQFPGLLDGVERNQTREHLIRTALHYPGVVSLLLKYLSNGLLDPQQPYSSLLALVTPLPLLVAGWRSWHRRQPAGAAWYLALTATLLLLLLLGTNEWLRVISSNRVRYLATLWPPAMLLISLVAWNPPRAFLRRPGSMILVLLVALSGITGFLGKNDLVRTIWRLDEYLPVAAARAIEAEGSSNGLLVFERNLFGNERRYELYTGAYGLRRMHLESDTASEEIIERSRGNSMVWLMTETAREDALRAHAGNLRQQGFFHCRSQRFTGDELSVVLELLLPPWPADMLRQSRLQFDDASLFAPEEPELTGDLLRLKLGLKLSGQGRLPNHSLAIHVIDSNTGARAAQDDVGVIADQGIYLPLCSEIDVSTLPPGDYEVRVALYNWQTGERSPARDLETGASGDMHALHYFRIG